MKFATGTSIYNTFRRADNIELLPRLFAEWNFNRYYSTTVTNIPDEATHGQDPERWPIESLSEPLRPGRGIVKTRMNDVVWNREYQERPEAARYYLISDEDKYKYWCSPYRTGQGGITDAGVENAVGALNFPKGTANSLSTVKPVVEYSKSCPANKIVVTFETTPSTPTIFSIDVRRGSTWSTISNNPTIGPEGRVTLWYSAGTWGETVRNARSLDEPTDSVNALRVKVDSMSTGNEYCYIIEMSLRHEANLTDYLMSTSETFDMSSRSMVAPMGGASANVGTLTLFNDYVFGPGGANLGFLFNTENPASPYAGMIDANVKFTLDYILDAAEYGGGSAEVIPGFIMHSTGWNGQRTPTVEVQVQDSSKFLQETKPNAVLYENISVGQIVWRLLDSIGFDRYDITARDDDNSTTVSHFWTDGSQTIWEILSDLTATTQTAVFFDERDRLQVWTRRQAYNETQPIRWKLNSVDDAPAKADIIDLSQTDQYEANAVTVNYQTTEYSSWNKGFPDMEIVWQPESTLTLRAAPLRRTMESGDDWIWLDTKDARIWPYEGLVNIEGEIIRYSGKQYQYYEGGVRKTTVVRSQGQHRDARDKTPYAQQHKNGFTGALRIVDTRDGYDRGVWNSEKKRHTIEVEGYNVRHHRNGNTNDGGGFRHNRHDSTVGLTTKKNYGPNDWVFATRGTTTDAGFYFLGTKMRFPSGSYKQDSAGIVFNNAGTKEDGYYVEFRPTRYMDGKQRQQYQEVSFYAKKNGTVYRLGGDTVHIDVPPPPGKKKNSDASGRPHGTKVTLKTGVPHQISMDTWFTVDVQFVIQPNNDHYITIMVNGQFAFDVTIAAGSPAKTDWNGKFGLYARGHTKVDYDFLYAISRKEEPKPYNLSFFERVGSSYSSNQVQKEWVWRERDVKKRRRKKVAHDTARFNQMFFDEYGPMVHEVREFDINFDPVPVLHSRLYVSNDYQTVCPEFVHSAFGAKFILANASRQTAVLHGEDTLTYSGASENSVNQQTLIFGRPLIQRDAKKVEVTNDDAIRRRGRVELEISSQWIQSKEDAEALGEWINEHWSKPSDELNVNVMGNPLFQIGDLVSVNYPDKDMSEPTHQYWVVGYTNDWDNGLTTSLTLRRRRN